MGKKWGATEKLNWFYAQDIEKSYKDEVLKRIFRLDSKYFNIQHYGALSIDPDKYPLYAITVGQIDPRKPTVVITGGVHGYEPSGIMGALQFLENNALDYSKDFNIVVLP